MMEAVRLRRRSGRTVSLSAGFFSRHLAVVGLGLMGGSLALALRPYAGTITGVEMDPAARDYALAHGVVDAATDDLKAGVSEADVVILAAPVRVIIDDDQQTGSARICARTRC